MKKSKKLFASVMAFAVSMCSLLTTGINTSALDLSEAESGYGEVEYVKTSISEASVSIESKTFVHTLEEIKPAVTVTLDQKNLEENTDYTVAYSDNVEVGTATVTVTGIDKYKDTASTTFEIVHDYSSEWTVDKNATLNEEGSKSHHCTVCGDKADITLIPKLTKLEGNVYYQKRSSDNSIRFIAEVAIEDVVQANSGNYRISLNDEMSATDNITVAYRSIYANGKLVTAPEGKCYIVTRQYLGFENNDKLGIQFNLENYDVGLTRDVTVKL